MEGEKSVSSLLRVCASYRTRGVGDHQANQSHKKERKREGPRGKGRFQTDTAYEQKKGVSIDLKEAVSYSEKKGGDRIDNPGDASKEASFVGGGILTYATREEPYAMGAGLGCANLFLGGNN